MPADAGMVADGYQQFLHVDGEARAVYVDGERVSDPTTHPAFREGARSIARLLDSPR